MKRWLLLALAVIAEVSGSLSMKLALDAPALYLVTAAGYIVAFAALAATLRAAWPWARPTASGVRAGWR